MAPAPAETVISAKLSDEITREAAAMTDRENATVALTGGPSNPRMIPVIAAAAR